MVVYVHLSQNPNTCQACHNLCALLTNFMAIYKISRDGVVLGEYDEAIVRRYIDAGSIKLHDFGWTVGMTEWKSLHELGFRVNDQAVPVPVIPLASSAGVSAAARRKPLAYYSWLLAAFFMPYLFVWRILFDKTFGYAKGVKVLFGLWLLFVLTFLAGTVLSDGGYYSAKDIEARRADPYAVRDNQEQPYNAGAVINVARSLIKKTLKAPSSAKFSDYANTDWEKTYDNGTKQFYVVSGWVESQNSFGAMLRANYLVCFSSDGRNVLPLFVRLGEDEEGEIPIECKHAFR